MKLRCGSRRARKLKRYVWAKMPGEFYRSSSDICATSGKLFQLKGYPIQAKRFFVSGTVQGVGFRFFVHKTAEKLHLSGYAKNLEDGRVEVLAIGTPEALAELHRVLEHGPRLANGQEVHEELAMIDPNYPKGFEIS